MAVLTEGTRAGEAIISEANGTRSRGEITVLSGQNLVAGAVIGKVTASGKYKVYTVGAADGSENAVAILFDAVDATSADTTGVILARDMEANVNALVWGATVTTQGHKDTAIASLATVGIIVR
jgi:hypothetical protein